MAGIRIPEVDECSANWARGGNRDVRRWVRSACSSAGNDFTQTIEAKFNTERCTRCRVVSFHFLMHPSLLASRNILPSFLVLVSVSASPVPALATPFLSPFLALRFRRRRSRDVWIAARRVRKEGGRRMPEGLAGLQTHRNICLRFWVADRFETVVVYWPFSWYQSTMRIIRFFQCFLDSRLK